MQRGQKSLLEVAIRVLTLALLGELFSQWFPVKCNRPTLNSMQAVCELCVDIQCECGALKGHERALVERDAVLDQLVVVMLGKHYDTRPARFLSCLVVPDPRIKLVNGLAAESAASVADLETACSKGVHLFAQLHVAVFLIVHIHELEELGCAVADSDFARPVSFSQRGNHGEREARHRIVWHGLRYWAVSLVEPASLDVDPHLSRLPVEFACIDLASRKTDLAKHCVGESHVIASRWHGCDFVPGIKQLVRSFQSRRQRILPLSGKAG